MDTFPWGDHRRFNSYNHFSQVRFGGRVQRIPIDAGFTCPNRDGSRGTGGCTYCLNNAFNPPYCNRLSSITQQIDDGIAFYQKRRGASNNYLAYFQAYSNTYAPLDRLQTLYEEALSHLKINGLVIATRPDCIDMPLLDYLSDLQTRTYITLELGIESWHDDTLRRINRGHDAATAIQALKDIDQHNIPVGIHLIFGLPGESPDTWLNDTQIINNLPVQHIKIHQLQIIKGTPMEQDFFTHRKDFHLFTPDSYVNFVADYLERLSPDIVIDRLAGEVPPRFLAFSNWDRLRYDELVKRIEIRLKERDTWQGKMAVSE